MKKQYVVPAARKVTFSYEQVFAAASSGCEMESIYTKDKDEVVNCQDYWKDTKLRSAEVCNVYFK